MTQPRQDIDDLLRIMRALRNPDGGCPWDLEQTFQTIAPYTLEEAYEVVEAIECNDLNALKDELGDLLLQVVFHAQMASEQGAFAFGDVVQAICDKMTRRHPHVFATADATVTKDQVRKTWAQIKQAERIGAPSPQSVLDGVPRALPALKRAQKLGSRASDVGFDWPDADGALAKLDEELVELRAAIKGGTDAEVVEEMGDVLFSMTNVCRHRGIDAEAALSQASAKFIRRFAEVERHMEQSDKPLSLNEMETAWERAKREDG